MRGMALIWAANVKGFKPAAKIVLIQLEDFHNKQTGQWNTSAKRLVDECEMGRASLFRHMMNSEEYGLVNRHARGDRNGGRGPNQYELYLDITLGPIFASEGWGKLSERIESQNEMGVASNRDRNLTIEPKKEPPSRRREVEKFEKILAAYPPDRLRGKVACLAQIEEAMKEGITPEDLLQAVQSYAIDSADFTRSKVCFSDNWFQSWKWMAYVEKQVEERKKAAALEADHHA
jgi:hypothetical protein